MANPGPNVVISPHQLLQADSSDGYLFGTLSTTPIGMYGVTPVAQRSNANQITVSSAAVAGTLLAVQTVNLAAAAVGANTTLSQAFTATGSPITASDVLAVNTTIGITAAGGILNVRAHSNTAGAVIMQFMNAGTGAGVTSAAAGQYQFASFRGLASGVVLTPIGVPANSTLEQTFNVTGVSVGELLIVNKAGENVGLGIAGVRVAGNNLIAINYMNVSTAAVTPTASETYNYISTPGLPANSNLLVYGVNVGTQLTPPVTTTTQSWAVTEQTITVSSILASDIALSMQKPTVQGAFSIANVRVPAASQLAIGLGAGSVSGVTPTGSEIYQTLVYRANAAAPLTLISVTCSPAAIAGTTSVEQAFTVTPCPATGFVWVNKPTATTGLGIVNCRVSAAGVVAIQFANSLVSTTITPPAEVYLFGVTQAYPGVGGNYLVPVANALVNTTAMANELRNALVGLGPIVGQ
jgi:hypothetical protein